MAIIAINQGAWKTGNEAEPHLQADTAEIGIFQQSTFKNWSHVLHFAIL